MKKLTILLFLILLPVVSASSFTGFFSDYGKDTNSDGLFDYLTIEAGASITRADNYLVFGRLEDSQGNFVEYEDCKSLLPVGSYTFILDFDGRKIYRKQVDGPYYLEYIELSTIDDCSTRDFPVYQHSLNDSYTTSFYGYKEFQKGKAAIYCDNSPCIASSALIRSRDNIDVSVEPNAPNTIDNCEDGTNGAYLSSESIESVTVTSLNHSNYFEIGDTVKVDINVYCSDGSDDKLNFVYSNDIDDIQWTVKDTKQCSSIGFQTLSTTFELDDNVGQHVIRGVFSIGLKNNTVCGEDALNGAHYWADNDDIVIYVNDSGEQKHELILTEGWNLVSLPKIKNNSIDEIVKIFNNDFESIAALRNGKWYVYDKLGNSNLDVLSESDGFWVKVNNDISVLIENESIGYASFELTKGWNLIGYPSMEEKDVNELFENVIDDIELVYVYDGEFESFNPQRLSNLIIKPGMGIFVNVKNGVSWYFDDVYNKNGELPKFNLNLSEGWNLISIPLESDKTINEIFGSKKLYYLESNKWKELENDDKINYSYGYWVKTIEYSLLIEGNVIDDLFFDINQGWNLINYPLTEEIATDVFFQDVIGDVELITSFEDGEWMSFNPLKPNVLNSLTVLKPGSGIFVKANDNAKWYFNGNELVATQK